MASTMSEYSSKVSTLQTSSSMNSNTTRQNRLALLGNIRPLPRSRQQSSKPVNADLQQMMIDYQQQRTAATREMLQLQAELKTMQASASTRRPPPLPKKAKYFGSPYKKIEGAISEKSNQRQELMLIRGNTNTAQRSRNGLLIRRTHVGIIRTDNEPNPSRDMLKSSDAGQITYQTAKTGDLQQELLSMSSSDRSSEVAPHLLPSLHIAHDPLPEPPGGAVLTASLPHAPIPSMKPKKSVKFALQQENFTPATNNRPVSPPGLRYPLHPDTMKLPAIMGTYNLPHRHTVIPLSRHFKGGTGHNGYFHGGLHQRQRTSSYLNNHTFLYEQNAQLMDNTISNNMYHPRTLTRERTDNSWPPNA